MAAGAGAGLAFACDFRIMVLGIEPDYWPHPGVMHPERIGDVAAWWVDTFNQLREAGPIT